MTDTDMVADFLNDNAGDYAPAFKFSELGDAVGGTVVHRNIVDGTDMKGQPTRSLVVTVETKEGGQWAIWVKPGNMLTNLGKALRDAKPGVAKPTVEVGDRIAVTFAKTEPSKTPGYAPKKVYEVAYKAAEHTPAPPAGGLSADDLI